MLVEQRGVEEYILVRLALKYYIDKLLYLRNSSKLKYLEIYKKFHSNWFFKSNISINKYIIL